MSATRSSAHKRSRGTSLAPEVSLQLLYALGISPSESVIDIGGGASTLVDHLYGAGHRDLAVLDVSAVALGEARARLGDPEEVEWINADVTRWQPARTWDAWHDRAVLHFLTDDRSRGRYSAVLSQALAPGGAFIIGAFSEDGPTRCSGLPVRRHNLEALSAFLGDVEIVEQRRHVHRTPAGVEQPFNWIAGLIGGVKG
ncbi:MAG: class I SAM-dependent methyltransferase [Microthrixaceae bacterium]|nr:class I SAM-dependent methyltransferase [Microthrixaceae bacterium]